jgi:hypothetical protein
MQISPHTAQAICLTCQPAEVMFDLTNKKQEHKENFLTITTNNNRGEKPDLEVVKMNVVRGIFKNYCS